MNKAPPPVTKKPRPLPGEEYENRQAAAAGRECGPGAAAGLDRAADVARAAAAPSRRTDADAAAAEQPQEPANGV